MLRRTLRIARATIFRRQSKQAGAGFKPTIEGVEERILLSTLPRGFTQSVVARGLIEPTGVVAVPDGRIFVIQQTGPGSRHPERSFAAPAAPLAHHRFRCRARADWHHDRPGLSEGSLYLRLLHRARGPVHNRVSRFTVVGNAAVPGSEVPLLDLPGLNRWPPQRRFAEVRQ